MKTIIMQPTYLPWMGYFDLIDQSDVFVFLDTAQFEKQSWQQRNRLLTPNGLEWITVPVLIKGRFGQPIREVEIKPYKFPEKHIRQIRQNYGRAPFFNQYSEELFDLLVDASKDLSLCHLNIELIRWCCAKLSLQATFKRSSEMGIQGKRSELLVNILDSLQSKIYVSPLGSLDYLREDRHWFMDRGIDIFFQNFTHPEYRQVYAPFTPGASIIDLLFNRGDESLAVLRSGRGNARPFHEVDV
ncbi:MAG: WbqC family protein [Magnetococcales bacterium]|nr:WbqC family protein [Magnetococcales bacterium]